MSMQELVINWPTAAITPQQWRERVEDLAAQAERMIGRRCTLQDLARLAVEWCGLCWSGFSPEVIAASARASLLLGENVVLSQSANHQLAEIFDRLEQITEAAQDDPSAAVATVPPPLLELPAAEPLKMSRRRAKPEVEAEVEAEVEPEVEAEVEPLEQEPEPEPEPEPVPPPAPVPEGRKRSASCAPAGWLKTDEVVDLLDCSCTAVSKWSREGRFGEEGVTWGRYGKSNWFSPDAVEALMDAQMPAGLDQLLADVQKT